MRIHEHGDWRGGTGHSLHGSNGQRKYLNNEERQRFLKAADLADPTTRRLCLILAYTGCRITEALSLTPSSIQFSEGLIAVRTLKKRGKLWVREVPVPEEVIAVLVADQASNKPGDNRLYPFGRTEAWKRIKSVMADAEVIGLQASPRGLRHGFAVSAVLAGVPLNIVQKWLGHATISTTSIYVDAVGAEERELMRRVWSEPGVR
jgi:integrase